MAFTPDLVVGVYVGKDIPEQMANETGSTSAVPIVLDFMQTVLTDETPVPFRIPDGMTLSPVNRDTGEPSFIGAPNVILEAFRPGTEPQIGSLDRTIRIGSGGDTFGSGFFGSGSGLAGERPPQSNVDSQVPALEDGVPTADIPVSDPLDPDLIVPPEEELKEEEEDLEDGLY